MSNESHTLPKIYKPEFYVIYNEQPYVRTLWLP